MEIATGISIRPDIRSDTPVITGTRVPVDLVLAKLAAGMTYDEVIEEYDISHEDILAVLDFAPKTLSQDEFRAVR